MWIRTLFFFFCILPIFFRFKEKPLVYYHNIIQLQGNGMRILLFQHLIKSDGAFFQFGDLVDERPFGYYLDTLSKEIFYNNYDVGIENLNYQDKNDFGKIYDVGKIELLSGSLHLRKQSLTNKTFNNFFYNKVQISDLNKEVLFALSDLNSKANSETNLFKQDVLVDLNSDGIKEKVRILFRIDTDGESEDERSQGLTLVFFTRKGEKWVEYDKTLLNSNLEKDIDQIIFFEQKGYVNIYINSSFTTFSGEELQSQVLLVGSLSNKPIRITK